MAGKKRKLNNEQDKVFVDLMQEVDWDDSALIDSWNKQKEEYKVSFPPCLYIISLPRTLDTIYLLSSIFWLTREVLLIL